MFTRLLPHQVHAKVRPDGAVGPLASRRFELMLDPAGSTQQKRREASRTLRQLGYEARDILIEAR